jgi:hypothetical protein
MPVTPEKIFVYGTFRSPKDLPQTLLNAVLSGVGGLLPSPDIAVEILREFWATELVGKVYVKGRGGNWGAASQPGIREFNWYKEFPQGGLVFETEGSNPWQVLYFREESDESGPYVAVGLRLG